MGCVCHLKKPVLGRRTTEIKSAAGKLFERKLYYRAIPTLKWEHIVDFLDFNDLKEVGKINSTFKKLSRSEKILLKFFKRTNEKIRNFTKAKSVLINREKEYFGQREDIMSKKNSIGTFNEMKNNLNEDFSTLRKNHTVIKGVKSSTFIEDYNNWKSNLLLENNSFCTEGNTNKTPSFKRFSEETDRNLLSLTRRGNDHKDNKKYHVDSSSSRKDLERIESDLVKKSGNRTDTKCSTFFTNTNKFSDSNLFLYGTKK